jgi:hypothetical protein
MDACQWVPSGFVHQGLLDAEIKNAIGKLGPEAVHVAYNLGADSTGEPSIFFRIETLTEVTGRIATILFDEVRPIENWDFIPISTFAASPNSEDGMIASGLKWHTTMIFSASPFVPESPHSRIFYRVGAYTLHASPNLG